MRSTVPNSAARNRAWRRAFSSTRYTSGRENGMTSYSTATTVSPDSVTARGIGSNGIGGRNIPVAT